MTALRDLLASAAAHAADHRDRAGERPVFPTDVDLDAFCTHPESHAAPCPSLRHT